MSRTTVRLLLAAGLLLVTSQAVQAIIIRHDKSDLRYQVLEERYPQLFYLHTRFDNKVCMATLVGGHWAITAAHCTVQTPILESLADGGDFTLLVGKNPYRVTEVVLHPRHDTGDPLRNVDLALIRLDRDVEGITPATLYKETDELEKVFSLLGWGYTGIGTRGRQTNDGKFRRAQNQVYEAGQWLKFRFDDPRETASLALPLEGIPGLGDSGGPALLETGAGPVLAGIAVGELQEGEAPEHQGLYGTTQLYERVSNHLEWIESILVQ